MARDLVQENVPCFCMVHDGLWEEMVETMADVWPEGRGSGMYMQFARLRVAARERNRKRKAELAAPDAPATSQGGA